MAFKLFGKKVKHRKILEKGQGWLSETVEENLALIEHEGCRFIFENLLPKNGMILEAGCGLGRWVFYFKRRGYKMIGCDINHQALIDAKGYDPSVTVITSDIHNLPFKDEYYDAVISLGVIEHSEDGPSKMIEEMRRILKPKGILFVAVPYNSLFRRFFVNHIIALKILLWRALRYENVFMEYRYSKVELIDFLKNSDFEILSCYPELLTPPKHIGIYLDYIHLTGVVPKKKFETPKPVSIMANLVRSISPWLISGMILLVARRKT